jgi:hypothetical protein
MSSQPAIAARGLVKRFKTGRTHVEVLKSMDWTCNFQGLLASRPWLTQIEDMIDGQRVALGQAFVGGRLLPEWSTINEAHAPGLFSSEGWSKVCPICGHV